MEDVSLEELIEREVPPDAPEWVRQIIMMNKAILERHMEDTGRYGRWLEKSHGEVSAIVDIMERFVGSANEKLLEFDERIDKLERIVLGEGG